MRKPKKIFVQFAIAAGIAGVLAVVAIVLAIAVINGSQSMARNEVVKATEAAKKAKEELEKQIAVNVEKRKLTVPEVRAVVDIPAETPIEDSMLNVQNVPQNSFLSGRIAEPKNVLGKMVRVPLMAGQPILENQLMGFDDPSILRPGYRAITVKVDPVGALNGNLQPGSRVDVLSTVKVADDSLTRTLLQNIMVLSVNYPPAMMRVANPPSLAQQTSGNSLKDLMNGTSSSAAPVTSAVPAQQQSLGNDKFILVSLMVTVQDAEKLALANEEGHFHLTMRGFSDKVAAHAPGMEINQLFGLPRPSHTLPVSPAVATLSSVQIPKVSSAPALPRRVFTMEVFKGASSETKALIWINGIGIKQKSIELGNTIVDSQTTEKVLGRSHFKLCLKIGISLITLLCIPQFAEASRPHRQHHQVSHLKQHSHSGYHPHHHSPNHRKTVYKTQHQPVLSATPWPLPHVIHSAVPLTMASIASENPTTLSTVVPGRKATPGQVFGPPKISVVKGRSQIIKFAQPVIRVSIADPTLADVLPLSPDQLMVNGKQRGVTSLVVWDEKGQEGVFDLQIQNDTTELMQAVKDVAPNEPVEVKITDDSFVLSGKLSNSVTLDDIKKLASAYGYKDANFIDLTDTQPTQVQLKVRIMEASRDIVRSLKTSFGLNSGGLNVTRLANPIDILRLGLPSGATGGLAPVDYGRFGNKFSSYGLNPIRPVAALQTSSNIGGVTGALIPSFAKNLDASWDFLETSGKVTTLAEPNLVVTHGRTADFLAGGEFPYVAGVGQNGVPTISFREYGVKLKFTPWLNLNSDRMEMTISPEVSAIDRANCINTAGSAVCGITKRTTSTTVGMRNGETLVISGILSKDDQKSFQKLPFVADIPVLGSLFKNSDTRHNERELVIIVTPTILPSSRSTSSLPSAKAAN